jgi:hypothetical protein
LTAAPLLGIHNWYRGRSNCPELNRLRIRPLFKPQEAKSTSLAQNRLRKKAFLVFVNFLVFESKTSPAASNVGEVYPMRTAFPLPSIALLALAFALSAQNAAGQNSPQPPPQPGDTPQPATKAPQSTVHQRSQQRSPGGDVGSGAGDIGKGAAKGTGAAAKGVGKGAVDLVTLHPLNAVGNVGKGAAVAGKDVGVGAAKGTGKIAKGTGRGIGKLFHHHHNRQTPEDSSDPQN